MSEPLTTSEIEDVLSSIRRLVSDEIRPSARSNFAAQPAPAVVRADDKLLLTPAFRVVQSAPRNGNDWFVEGDDPRIAEFEPEKNGLDAVVTRLGAQMPAYSEEWENEEGDTVLTGANAAEESQEWQDFSANDAFEDDAFLADASAQGVASAVRDVVQPEEILPYAQHDDEAELLAPENAEDIPGWAQSEEAEEGADDLTDEEIIAEVKELPFVSARSTAWADAAEASVIASLAQQERQSRIHRAPVADAAFDTPTQISHESAIDAGELRFDEDVLRELVRDLIREELQGKLGERMTRSVRKLVRVELLRLLATREFEE